MPDLLPDCRSSQAPQIYRGVAGTWQPVFCANCGGPGGMVPAEGMTFLFYLCNVCATTYGEIAGTMMMPDEVFFEKLAQAQMEYAGRYLTLEEWGKVGEDASHPLWPLLRDQPK